jgi:hypothetical protein
MSSITAVAEEFFAACETGKGWAGCRAYCTPDASFPAQSEPLANVHTLEAYSAIRAVPASSAATRRRSLSVSR